ncbi:Non-reducing polyketide synthase ascC [Podospora australis]|uniref:Non-reducing polyketide synthase ascC n=1 Tax=Podospora australis TaxID=1536484 RepID=A0AAN6WQZ1_9PEZI|nr:Non-reducing polyketide synthase ascC [Podospora australis]
MTCTLSRNGGPSAAVFSAQSSPPKPSHLAHIRNNLLQDPLLEPLADAVKTLPETWRSLSSSISQPAVADARVEALPEWIEYGRTETLERDMSGLVTLPLLITIQIVQYIEYIQRLGLKHAEFLQAVKNGGGVQGYCIGLLSAIIVACSVDEQDLVKNAVSGIRLALGIGAFGDREQMNSASTESNTLQIRLRNAGDEDALIRKFPGTYISTVTDTKTISIIAPADDVAEVRAYAEIKGMRPRMMHIRSNLHNPDNESLLEECSSVLRNVSFPTSDRLAVTVCCNRTGASLSDSAEQSLSEEIIRTILASRCDWLSVMQNMAHDLAATKTKQHNIAIFGLADPVSTTPFQREGLEVSKVDVMSLLGSSLSQATMPSSVGNFPENAIAVVGAACRLPGASTIDQLWDLISEDKTRLEPLRTDRVNIKASYRASQDQDWVSKREFFGNFIDDVEAFDNGLFGISPREAQYMDPQQRLLLETAYEAMDAAGYLRDHLRERGDPIGCFVGACYTEYLENTSAYSPSAFTATSTIRAFLSGKISYHFGWTGPSEVIDTACSASIVAVHRAVQAINTGECTMALAGGVNIITGINNYFDLGRANFLSKTGQCKPFDDSADGYCRADGVGLVVLKSLKQAVQDGDHILGVIPAVATNQGGIGAPGITVPDGILQKALYNRILEKSGIQGDQVTYVEAHGTGTQVGDPIEISSVREVFGSPLRKYPVFLGSLKANVGHSETAAGVGSLIKVLSMLKHKGIPPLQGFKTLNKKIPSLEKDKMQIPTKALPWDFAERRIAAVNSYGASGSNSALLCAEWLPETTNSVVKGEVPVLLSAASESSLHRYASNLADYIARFSDDLTLGDLSFTLSQKRKHHRIRWSTTASSLSQLVNELKTCTPQDFVNIPKSSKKIVLAFSGQSRTTIGVSQSARQENPRFDQYVQTCSEILKSFGCPDILPYLSQTEPIDDPTILQCGTVAVQYACAQCWIDGGLDVSAIVGHSLGELTALAVSGVLSLADTLKVVYTRAELIKAKWGAERGTMLAIHTELSTVKSIMEVVKSVVTSSDEELELACYNSMTSNVVVGRKSSVEKAEKIIRSDKRYQNIRHQRLNVSHGFHSRFTAPLLEDLMKVDVQFREATIPLETSSRTPVIFNTKTTTTQYLANHARDSVHFVDAVRRVEQKLGACVWLEAGWNTPIVAMTKRAVANSSVHTFQAVTSPATAAAELWKDGMCLTHWPFLTRKKSGLRHVYLPPYSFDRSKHWLKHVDRAVEERDLREKSQGTTQAITASSKTQQLVTYKGSSGPTHDFRLNTSTERYTRIVSGHAVRSKPLCPASMYMESAIMGLDLLGVSAKGKTTTFENVVFNRPLGCDSSLDVRLTLNQTEDSTYKYAVSSGSANAAPHSEGTFSLSESIASSDLQLYEMLIAEQMASLRSDPAAEKLRTGTAYSLFSRIVEYADLMRGISTITLVNRQALAQIVVPKSSFAQKESSVSDFYDAISLDTFIQVLGLLINCTTGSSSEDNGEIYVAGSIGKMVMSPTDFTAENKWTVFAVYNAIDSKTSSGAVFVFAEASNKLVGFANGIQFVKVQARMLERVLESANPGLPSITRHVAETKTAPKREVSREAPEAVAVSQKTSSAWPMAATVGNSAADLAAKVAELKALISSYTGVPANEMEDSQDLGSMGLDSLASMELADEMESKLRLQVQTEDLLTATVGSLLRLISPSALSSAASAPESTGSAPADDTCSEASDHELHRVSTNSTAITTLPTTPTEVCLHSKAGDPIDGSVPWIRPIEPLPTRFKLETVTYKEVDGVEIKADLYVPTEPPSRPMPVALMVHGGGHLTLSRRAVRPEQTKFLLSQGIFPVSVDYRLAPQVNVIEGSMADVRDACSWIQKVLPKIVGGRVELDASKYVVIGWSTGGTLAMTTAWTLQSQPEIRLPAGILSFYCPVVYDPSAPIKMGDGHASRTMPLSEIKRLLGNAPTTYSAPNSLDTTKLGWVDKGDPRSELVLALVKEPHGMALLFNDDPLAGDELRYPDEPRAREFSPLNHLRRGDYHVPTYLIFGDQDEIAPFPPGEEFGRLLKDTGKGDFLAVEGAVHIFDLGHRPGSEMWERGVGPGYRFLLERLEGAHRDNF